MITTSTPGDGPGEFFNTLTPSLDLYDPAGNLVAANVGGGADGRNARIEYTAAASGLYTIRVATPEPAWLEYVLDVTGHGRDLGPVDYLELPGIGARADGSAFALETTHDGILTLTATPSSPGGTVGLALYDQDPPAGEGTAPVATSTLVDGRQRIDYEVQAGQTYYFRITGDGSLADLTLANVFNRQGGQIEVYGSGGADRFEFCATAPRALKINDLLYKFLQGEVGSISFDGGEGDDSAVLLGGPRDETVTLRPGEGTLICDGYQVSVANTANIAARGMGGHDTVTFYDSPGQDNFVATPAYASLQGDGYCNQAWKFAEVRAYATAGGSDMAKLYDSPGNDAYVGTPTYNMLGGQGFHNEVWYFDFAHALATAGGIDEAKFYDSPGDDLYSASPGSASLSVPRIAMRTWNGVSTARRCSSKASMPMPRRAATTSPTSSIPPATTGSSPRPAMGRCSTPTTTGRTPPVSTIGPSSSRRSTPTPPPAGSTSRGSTIRRATIRSTPSRNTPPC